MTPVTPDPI